MSDDHWFAPKSGDPTGIVHECQDSDIEPMPGGEWARCRVCGDDTFPLVEDPADPDDEPVRLHEATPEVDEGLIAVLERILVEAKRGEIFGLVACVERTGREYGTAIAGEFNPFSMLGHLEAAKLRVAATRIDGSLGD